MKKLLCLALFAALVGTAAAQTFLRDINPNLLPNNGSLLPIGGVVQQGVYYFSGTRYDTGAELWRSDGTVAGSYLVKDLVLGTASSYPQYFSSNGTLVFFVAGYRIWRSDGTAGGTYALSPTMSSMQGGAVPAGTGVVWVQNVGASYTLWGSDGVSTTPTALLSASSFGTFAASGNRTYFAACEAASGWELWYTDATAAGTVLIDTVPGPNGIYPTNLCSDGAGGVWFSAQAPGVGDELWHSLGSVFDTLMVADLWPGSQGSSPRYLCAVGNRVFFAGSNSSQGEELWVSDGTAAGSYLVRDLWPGSNSGSPSNLFAVPALGRVFFSATDATAGREPWISDGTLLGTYRLADLAPGSAGSNLGSDLYPGWFGGQIYFAGPTPASGRELYRTDGTVAGTMLAADLYPGPDHSEPRFLAEVPGAALFYGHSPVGTEMYALRPPATVPTLLADLNPPPPAGSFPTYMYDTPAHAASLDGRQHFAAYQPTTGTEPWAHAGTSASTAIVGNVVAGASGHARLLAATSTHVYYEESDTSSGGTYRLVAVPMAGAPVVLGTGAVLGWAVLRDRLVFAQNGTNSEPRITDGTVAGTQVLFDVRPGTASSSPSSFATCRDRVYFAANDGVHGQELWVTDGTPGGTALAVDVVAGPTGSNLYSLVGGDTLLYFRASGVVWVSDGTPAGTASVPAMAVFSTKTTFRDLLIEPNGYRLWRTDGTAAGTFVLAQSDATSGETIGTPCLARGLVFFTMDRNNAPPELWVTDGSLAGTHVVHPLHVTPNAAAKPICAAGLGHVACSVTTSAHGGELWVSDGTAAGTVMVADLAAGPLSSDPAFALGDATAGGYFTWWPETLAAGREPWTVPLAQFGGSDFDRYGAGCPGSRGVPQIRGDGLPILGSPRCAFVLERALPNSFACLLLGFTRLPGPTPCELRNSGEVIVGLFTDAGGRAEHSLAVPQDLGLLSVKFAGQFVVLDPQGQAFGFASGTAGLEALLGR